MIVGCPACRRQYRLDDARVRPGARMRCTRCGHLFDALADAAPARAAEPKVAAVPAPPTQAVRPGPALQPGPAVQPGHAVGPAPAALPARPSATAPAPAAVAPARGGGGEPLAVLADAGRPFGPGIQVILEEMGCRVRTVGDGTAAFRIAVADHPALMVVSVHLAGLSGIAICEGVKNSPHLKDIRVAIVGSDLSADLFNRDTALAYGADLFLEEGLPEAATRQALHEMLVPEGPGAASGDDIGDALAGLTGATAGPPGAGEDIRRLARIMLADLRLYNPERFSEALASRRLLEVFKDELSKGRAIVEHRFPDLPGRQEILAAALEEGVKREHGGRPAA